MKMRKVWKVLISCCLLAIIINFQIGHVKGLSASRSDADWLDPTFGQSGIVTTDLGSGDDYAYAGALQSDGKIIAVGEAQVGGGDNDKRFTLVRYNSDGSLDTSFSEDGIYIYTIVPVLSGVYAVDVDPATGRIVVAGTIDYDDFFGDGLDFGLGLFNSNGTLVSDYGTGGGNVIDFFGEDDIAYGVGFQSDGKVVAAGDAVDGDDHFIALVRLDDDGDPDTTFGGDGKITTSVNGFDFGIDLLIYPDDRLLVAGSSYDDSVSVNDFVLTMIRYTSDGILDTTFGGDGIVTIDLGDAWAWQAILQPDGKIVVASEVEDVWAITRFESNGNLDTTFGSGGVVITGFAGVESEAWSIALQNDGKIMAAGYVWNGDDCDIAVARYNPDGSLDESFASDGTFTYDFEGDDDFAEEILIQPDGKIVLVGTATVSGSEYFTILRLSHFENYLPLLTR